MPNSNNTSQAMSNSKSAAWGAAGAVGSTIINQLFAERNRKQNFYWNEKAAKEADKRQRAQYMDLYSPEAQMQQLKDAGLSPSLMYGNGGGVSGGNASGNMSMAASGPQAPYMSAMEAAQIANIMADTKGKEIDNENKQNIVDATLAQMYSQITLNGSITKNKDANTAFTNAQTALTTAQTEITKAKQPYEIRQAAAKADTAEWNTHKVIYEALNAGYEVQFNAETFEKRKQQIEADLNKTIQEIAVLKEDEALKAQMANYYYELPTLTEDEISTKEKYNEHYEEYVKNSKDVALAQIEKMLEGIEVDKKKALLQFIGNLIGTAGYLYVGSMLKAPGANMSLMLMSSPQWQTTQTNQM